MDKVEILAKNFTAQSAGLAHKTTLVMLDQRTLTIGGRITVWLVSSLVKLLTSRRER